MNKRKNTFNHGDKESRLRKACERLGSGSPHCIFHDEPNPFCLQLHHVAGREFDDETITLCHNHHARVSDAQKDLPSKIEGCTNPLENLGQLVLGWGELVALMAEDIGNDSSREFLSCLRWKLKEIGLRLIEHARLAPHANPGDER